MRNPGDAITMLDAFYATNSPETLEILVKKILNADHPDETLVTRFLTGLVVIDQQPIPVSLWKLNYMYSGNGHCLISWDGREKRGGKWNNSE